MNKRIFASDNFSGVLPEVLQAINRINTHHVPSYGYDHITKKAVLKFKKLLGKQIEVYFVFNGTAANIISLSAITETYHSIICAATSHLHTDECGAAEKHLGCKVISIPTENGKLSINDIEKVLEKTRINDEHQSQPKVVSITQSTECGTVYSVKEIKDLADFLHRKKMYLHVDGARIANALTSLNIDIREMIRNTGVDVLSFGGTKNGMMYGEAVVFLNLQLGNKVKYIRKQNMQLASKMRYISAQFDALLTNDLWLKTASRSNKLAKLLADEILKIPQIKITQKVQTNMVFAIIPKHIMLSLQKEYFFYVWNTSNNEVRWVCSFDNIEADVYRFVNEIKKLLKA